jgi:hypothetical protein
MVQLKGAWALGAVSGGCGGYGIAVFILFCKADGSDVSSCVWCVFGDRAREECCRAVPAAGIQGLGVQGWGATGIYVRHGHTGVWLSGAQRSVAGSERFTVQALRVADLRVYGLVWYGIWYGVV